MISGLRPHWTLLTLALTSAVLGMYSVTMPSAGVMYGATAAVLLMSIVAALHAAGRASRSKLLLMSLVVGTAALRFMFFDTPSYARGGESWGAYFAPIYSGYYFWVDYTDTNFDSLFELNPVAASEPAVHFLLSLLTVNGALPPEVVAQSVRLAFGIAGVLLVYGIAQTLGLQKETAIFVGALLSVSFEHFAMWASDQFRGYVGLTALVGVYYCLSRSLTSSQIRNSILCAAALSLLAAFCHKMFWFTGAGAWVSFLFAKWCWRRTTVTVPSLILLLVPLGLLLIFAVVLPSQYERLLVELRMPTLYQSAFQEGTFDSFTRRLLKPSTLWELLFWLPVTLVICRLHRTGLGTRIDVPPSLYFLAGAFQLYSAGYFASLFGYPFAPGYIDLPNVFIRGALIGYLLEAGLKHDASMKLPKIQLAAVTAILVAGLIRLDGAFGVLAVKEGRVPNFVSYPLSLEFGKYVRSIYPEPETWYSVGSGWLVVTCLLIGLLIVGWGASRLFFPGGDIPPLVRGALALLLGVCSHAFAVGAIRLLVLVGLLDRELIPWFEFSALFVLVTSALLLCAIARERTRQLSSMRSATW